MSDKETLIQHIHEAFVETEYPGDPFLLGSREGCEPYEEVGPFEGKEDWTSLDSEFLDAHYNALSFFSDGGFRFFLPAYLIADLKDELNTADPVFHLTHGFCDSSVEVPTQSGVVVRKFGKSVFVNPRRYGAMTSYDYARYRLAVFTQEEAQAIVGYLSYRRDSDPHGIQKEEIDAALNLYWLKRAEKAPSAKALKQHLEEEASFLKGIDSGIAE
jgi:hypothetical protein